MSEHHDRFLDLCAARALGCIDDADRRLLEEHLEGGCPECEAALREYGEAVELYAASAPPALPRRALRKRVLGTVGPLRRTNWNLVAAAMALAAVVTWWISEQFVPEHDPVRVVYLEPTPEGTQELIGVVYFHPRDATALVALWNYMAPEGKAYELWALRTGRTPQSLGLVRADAQGHASIDIEEVGDAGTIEGFAVSLEPAGGAPPGGGPTGPVVSVGGLD